jgi:hypothetical protein
MRPGLTVLGCDEPGHVPGAFADVLALLDASPGANPWRSRAAVLPTSLIETPHANAGLGCALSAVQRAYVAHRTEPSGDDDAVCVLDIEALRAVILARQISVEDLRRLRRALARVLHPDLAGQPQVERATGLMAMANGLIDEALAHARR